MIISIIIVILTGSINHPNMNWSDEEFLIACKKSRIATLLISFSILMLNLLIADKTYTYYLSMGIIVCAISMVVEKIRKEGDNHENSREVNA